MKRINELITSNIAHFTISVIVSYLFTTISSHYGKIFFGIPNNIGIWLLCWIGFCTLAYTEHTKKHAKEHISLITGETIFLSLQILFAYLFNSTDLSVSRIVLAIAWALFFSYSITSIICKISLKINSSIHVSGFRNFISINTIFTSALILFLMWTPYLLMLYPGVFAVDVPTQVVQHFGTYNTHHPLAHTLLIQGFIAIGDILNNRTFGVCLYNVLQMLTLSFSFAYLLSILDAVQLNRHITRIILIWLGIFPVFPTMSISVTKDTYFTAFYIIFATSLIYLCHNYKSKFVAGCYIAGTVGSILFRNNGIFAIIPAVAIAIFLTKKKYNYHNWIIGISVILAIALNFSLIMITHATSSDTNNEALSIPYQQLARVYCYEHNNLSKQEKSDIIEYIPNANSYNPFISDPVKDTGRANANYSEFFKLYFKLGIKYPLRYLEAFLCNNDGYLFIDSSSFEKICEPGANDGTVGYLDTSIWTHYGVERTSYLPSLLRLLRQCFVYNEFQNIPAINILFHYSIYIWINIAATIYTFCKKKRDYYPVMIGNIFLLMTFLMGPAALLRYIMAFMPLGIVLPFAIVKDKSALYLTSDGIGLN